MRNLSQTSAGTTEGKLSRKGRLSEQSRRCSPSTSGPSGLNSTTILEAAVAGR